MLCYLVSTLVKAEKNNEITTSKFNLINNLLILIIYYKFYINFLFNKFIINLFII